mmetsp:Transcript_79791/g.223918  ORF Transcript_79791/g.223918 Transcript_79791/m.223918 type:complete len:325 (-) Transcript_79791:365-1339(-)
MALPLARSLLRKIGDPRARRLSSGEATAKSPLQYVEPLTRPRVVIQLRSHLRREVRVRGLQGRELGAHGAQVVQVLPEPALLRADPDLRLPQRLDHSRVLLRGLPQEVLQRGQALLEDHVLIKRRARGGDVNRLAVTERAQLLLHAIRHVLDILLQVRQAALEDGIAAARPLERIRMLSLGLGEAFQLLRMPLARLRQLPLQGGQALRQRRVQGVQLRARALQGLQRLPVDRRGVAQQPLDVREALGGGGLLLLGLLQHLAMAHEHALLLPRGLFDPVDAFLERRRRHFQGPRVVALRLLQAREVLGICVSKATLEGLDPLEQR